MISIDFETHSTTDLRKVGVYKYVEDPNTGIWCMAWAIDDGDTHLWTPGQPLPSELLQALQDGEDLRAWNAQFERVVWNTVGVERYGFPSLGADRFWCTQADALAMGLPSKLEKAAQALRLPVQKDMAGNRLAIQMSKPRKLNPLSWWYEPAKLQALYEYCEQDVRTEHEVFRFTRRIGDDERAVYLLDQKINDRGVRVDRMLVENAKQIAFEGIKRANAVVAAETDGDVDAVTQVGRLQHWLREQGCSIPDLKATTLQKYLRRNLSPEVRRVLLARAEAGKASVAKLDKMLEMLCGTGRLHGLLQYHGAATGRWAGRGVQPQNFPRGTVKNVEQFLPMLVPVTAYDVLDMYANPVDIILSLLRSMLVASSGHRLMAADFSAIEARVLAWLAGQDDLVEAFRRGEDVYQLTADAFSTTRQVGKAVILGAGYGMGWKKFLKMALDSYGVDLSEGESQKFIKQYRERYSKIPAFWRGLEALVLQAVQNEGVVVEGYRCRFIRRGEQLWLILPSKRPLCYMYPRIVERETPWGGVRPAVEISTVDSFTKKWVRRDLYGGLLAENIVQAVSRDLLVHSMFAVENAGYPIIMTVHDEIVVDVPDEHGSFEEFNALTSSKPAWAEGCPVKSGGWEGKRYRKG